MEHLILPCVNPTLSVHGKAPLEAEVSHFPKRLRPNRPPSTHSLIIVRISIGGIATIAFTLLDLSMEHSALGMNPTAKEHEDVAKEPTLEKNGFLRAIDDGSKKSTGAIKIERW
uniref:AlNc14C31G2865 protein n=1 Tax=Albugo laibachii Nc14 TaxID=890382 RepID=F0W7R1_9STRA|nr:AlNc14C31G2865 [Albugo laibachii Nc14]|eukprot:CCA17163.1 AlNc14C31G2865 [Albugo laibachii Nc14]